jgi:Fic family protein
MQVVSGAMGKEKVHFEAPEADRLEEEMRQFISWFNEDKHMDPVISSKWAKITKTSPDTALRDIQDLLNKNILMKEVGGGRSTSYVLID